jgi:hypothetical protein
MVNASSAKISVQTFTNLTRQFKIVGFTVADWIAIRLGGGGGGGEGGILFLLGLRQNLTIDLDLTIGNNISDNLFQYCWSNKTGSIIIKQQSVNRSQCGSESRLIHVRHTRKEDSCSIRAAHG